ncbi:hypothetical protein CXX84_08630 [Arthrobacter sp. AFG7.2]|uniref:hypothetical protein n=1 Tax=Arthrobacter sp. AFG7.2 TaxID=1688693 RepID=UPI000C9E79EE|nr:hypothetical protein [Arthrobacter sp. AFG7.2]PNI08656.1 hypothetical protein CXX84_08630 [Arthrobacter sp. AFG7.2]
MTDSPVIHVQREQGMDLFWRGALVFAILFNAAIVAVFIGVPAVLMVKFWNPWLLFTLIFVAAGVLLLVKFVAALRKGAWYGRHRSLFVLHETGIETTEWNTVGSEAPLRRVIPLEAVAGVVASYRIVRRTLRTRFGGGILTETAPVLHVLFDDDDGRRRISSVPFTSHEDPAVDTWIRQLRANGVELGYTARPLLWKEEDYLSDEARLEYFAATEEIIDFPSEGSWLENTARAENRWHHNSKRLQEEAEQRDPALRAARLKPTGRHWILGAWFAGMYTSGSGYLLPYLVQRGVLPVAAWPLELLVVLPAAALFFLPLRHGLRWYHALVCWLLLVVIAFTVVVGTAALWPAAEEMAMIGLGVTVLAAALLWVPYQLVKRSVPLSEQTHSR